jgi:hypothetical protein
MAPSFPFEPLLSGIAASDNRSCRANANLGSRFLRGGGTAADLWLARTGRISKAEGAARCTRRDMKARVQKSKLIKGATGDWEVVIGMEIHAQVASQSKLFSGASTAFGGEPNAHVSLVDAAMPGMLPVINEECVKQAVRTGLGLKARINLKSVFDRKNYFYPDLPQGYQISQYKSPVVGGARSRSTCRTARRSGSASSGSTSSRMPASRCTTGIRPCPMSISTAPAWR